MSKDRDIDDILESLNQLLREGESHNDDHVESHESPEKVAAAADDIEPADSAEFSTDEGSENIPEAEPEAEADQQWQQDEFDEDDYEEESVSDDGDEPFTLHRVVLTEDMLVDNPQRSLLSLVRNRVDDGDSEEGIGSEPNTPKTESLIDHALMAELLDLIADDVTRQLPILIKTSLEQHLKQLLHGHQSSDSTDQTEE